MAPPSSPPTLISSNGPILISNEIYTTLYSHWFQIWEFFSKSCKVVADVPILYFLGYISPPYRSRFLNNLQIRLGNLKAEAAKIKNRIETASDVTVKQIGADVELQVFQ